MKLMKLRFCYFFLEERGLVHDRNGKQHGWKMKNSLVMAFENCWVLNG